MKKFLAVLVVFAFVLFFNCSKSSQSSPAQPEPTQAPSDVQKKYSGSASKGDLITFEINQTQKTFKITNETTSYTYSNSYTDLTVPELTGVHKAVVNDPNAGTINCYAIELADGIICANFPTSPLGAGAHYISFGVSQAFDNTGKENMIAGDYIGVHVWDQAINGSTAIKIWGMIRVDANGRWKLKNYATKTGDNTIPPADPATPSSYGNVSYVAGAGDSAGDWAISGTNKERLKVWDDANPGTTLTGYAFADASGNAAFLLDMGPNQGFIMALKEPAAAISQASMAGTYKYVDIWYHSGAWPGAGNYTIPSSGTGTYTHIDLSGNTTNGNLTAMTQCAPLTNMFLMSNVQIDSDGVGGPESYNVYLAVLEDVIFHFIFDTNGDFVSYGIGVKQ